MTIRPPLLLAILLALGLALVAPPEDAFARGGRYGAPARPPADREDQPDEPCTDAGCDPVPPPVVEAPAAAVPTTGEMPRAQAAGTLTRGRRGAWYGPGMTSWIWWYEANRERYEDLRRRRFQTPAAPLFGVGQARGPMVGRVTVRVAPRQRERLLGTTLAVVNHPKGEWIHTHAAALVALGKLAENASHVQPLTELLSRTSPASAYLKESAALGLGQMKRSDPDVQLPAKALDKARVALATTLRDDQFQPRTRAFCALSLGLLGDQPSARGDDGARFTAETLFHTWTNGDLPDEVQVGILMGMVRLPPDAITSVMRLVLEGCALRGRHWNCRPSTLVRGNAVLTLAEIGTAQTAAALKALLDPKHKAPVGLKQAAALATGILGERFPDTRADLGRAALAALDATKEPGTRHSCWMTLGRLLAADSEIGATALLDDHKAGRHLLAALDTANLEERPFVSLAMAIAIRTPCAAEEEPYVWNLFRTEAVKALRKAFADKGDAQNRGAVAVALGLARDGRSVVPLLNVLKDEDQTPELRAYAALGLGLLGDGRREVVKAVTHAVRDPRDRVLQMRAATAIGLLDGGIREDRDAAIDILLAEMRRSQDQVVKGQIAITLARIGDSTAIAPLIRMAQGQREPHLNRAMAIAALGLIGDCEIHPVLAASRWNSHYLSHASVVRDILDTL